MKYKVTVERTKRSEVSVEAETRDEALAQALGNTKEPSQDYVRAWVSDDTPQIAGQYL